MKNSAEQITKDETKVFFKQKLKEYSTLSEFKKDLNEALMELKEYPEDNKHQIKLYSEVEIMLDQHIYNSETKEISIIDFFVINTENGNVYAQIDGVKREIEKLNSGEYCFISKNRILEKTIWLGHFSKAGKLVNDKYANIFNKTDQNKTENYFNS